MPIRLGIIGLSAEQTAWATSAHVMPLKSPLLSDKYTITALATSSPESAKAAAKAHGVPESKAYHTPEAIANDPDVDMIVVSVKVPLHKQMVLPALNAKKPVFVEWALGKGVQEAEEMAALAKKQGVKTMVGLQLRLNPVFLKVSPFEQHPCLNASNTLIKRPQAKELIDSGAIGRILNTTLITSTSIYDKLPDRSEYINDPKNGKPITCS